MGSTDADKFPECSSQLQHINWKDNSRETLFVVVNHEAIKEIGDRDGARKVGRQIRGRSVRRE